MTSLSETAALTFALLSVVVVFHFLRMRRIDRAIISEQPESAGFEARLSEVLRSIGYAVITTDVEGAVVGMNPEAEDKTVWTIEEARGRPLAEVLRIVDSKTGEPFADPAKRAIEDGSVADLFDQSVLIARDGSEYRIAGSAVPVSDVEGVVTGVALVFRDETEQIRMREELRQRTQSLKQEQDFFSRFFQTIPHHMYIKDRDSRFLRVNQGMAKLVGLKDVEEAIGKSDFDFFLNEHAQQAYDDEQRIMRTGEPKIGYEEKETWQADRTTWCLSTKMPLRDHLGEVTGLIGISHDITERKQAELGLRHLRSYLANIIDSMPSVLVGVDPDGNVTQWNAEAHKATGVSAEKATGQPLNQAFPRLATEMEQVREAIETRQVRAALRQSRKEDGETRYGDVTVYPLVANDVEGAVIRIDDVTEKVRLEEMMIQSEKMLSVGGLAAGMAHEISNPLAGMIQTASVMSDRLSEDLPANLKAAEAAGTSMEVIRTFMDSRGIPRMLAAINQSGRRVAVIVDNMLSFARRSDAERSSHSVAELLDQTVELAATDYDLKRQYDFRLVEIVRDYQDDLPQVPCEGAKIQQVFLNILRNGAQAMQEAGTENPTLTLRTRHEMDSGLVCIEIQDNGPGMDDATRKRAFEPFFTTKPVGVGTGLGLSVSYFIISSNHGGTLDLVTEPDKGTTFSIRLPVEGGKP